jgi:phenylpropionate dioxygenase-like ring-hydroxylating dioxygenase large terminal subunit
VPTSFPLNAWYAAAWDVDLKHALFPRTICGKHVVMYRQSNGQVSALEDACWHRLVPLSKGRLDGDTLVCGYHGLKYNAQGRCTYMPSQETINPSACVRSYPVVERHRFVCCGWAIRRSPIPRWCRTCTGTTIRPGPGTARPFM